MQQYYEFIPFTYLDSSTLIRTKPFNLESLSRQALEKSPNKFSDLPAFLKSISSTDNQYYYRLQQLQKRGIISSIITLETINENLMRDKRTVQLFGDILSIGGPLMESLKGISLWGDEICHSRFYNAAMAIVESTNIIADPNFFSFCVCNRLGNYIPSKAKLFLLGNDASINCNSMIEKKVVPYSPKSFVSFVASFFD